QNPFALLVALQADRVDLLDRMSGIIGPERDHPADTAAAAAGHMQRARTMTVLALHRAFPNLADLAHQGLGKGCSLPGMTARADLRPDKGRLVGAYRLDRLGLGGLRGFRLFSRRQLRLLVADPSHEVAQRRIGILLDRAVFRSHVGSQEFRLAALL